MIDIIISISGPLFLFIYTILAVLVIFIAKKYVDRYSSSYSEIPEPSQINPIDIALIKFGVKGAIDVSIYNLWKENIISIENKKINDTVLKLLKAEVSKHQLSDLDKKIVDGMSINRTYSKLLTENFINDCESILEPNIEKLQDLSLLVNENIIDRYKNASAIGGSLLIIFGGVKLYLGIMRDKPIAFLVILMIVSLFLLFKTFKPKRIDSTLLGKQFLEASSQRFEWIRQDSNALQKDNNLLYGIALFGIATIPSSFIIPELIGYTSNSAFNLNSDSGGGCGGGCGDGGGCSSGCGSGCGGD